jgi:hypothetical protein
MGDKTDKGVVYRGALSNACAALADTMRDLAAAREEAGRFRELLREAAAFAVVEGRSSGSKATRNQAESIFERARAALSPAPPPSPAPATQPAGEGVEPLPCPHCGGDAFPWGCEDGFAIECQGCHCRTSIEDTPGEAVSLWNARAALPKLLAEVRRLRNGNAD